jgi:hypothetical protein
MAEMVTDLAEFAGLKKGRIPPPPNRDSPALQLASALTEPTRR